jgi:hypothetical protein
MLIYCDSVILIYWLDDVGPFHLRADLRMKSLQTAETRSPSATSSDWNVASGR